MSPDSASPGTPQPSAATDGATVFAIAVVAAPPEQVYGVLTDPARMRGWQHMREGRPAVWRHALEGGRIRAEARLTDGTTVTYLLESSAQGTRVCVRHEGFEGLRDCAERHASLWKAVLAWLREDANLYTSTRGA
jgi:hypothetical protein